MEFLKIREGGIYEVIVDVARDHKRSTIQYSLTLKVVSDAWNFHECEECIYNNPTGPVCAGMCRRLENLPSIQKFVKEKFGINLLKFSIIPTKRTKHEISEF